MTAAWVTQVVLDHDEEPSAAVVLQLLEVVGSEQNLEALVDAAIATSRLWSLRLAAIALVRTAKATPTVDSSDATGAVLRLSQAAKGDDAATGTCLTALKWLAETDRLHSRNELERRSALELLWRSLSAEHANTRSAAVHTLEAIYDFSHLAKLLGDDGVEELRRRLQQARAEADVEVAEELASTERLLP